MYRKSEYLFKILKFTNNDVVFSLLVLGTSAGVCKETLCALKLKKTAENCNCWSIEIRGSTTPYLISLKLISFSKRKIIGPPTQPETPGTAFF